jgi:peptidoglycan/xylan/chitin deacetylase (PgdA/CDA1 family)
MNLVGNIFYFCAYYSGLAFLSDLVYFDILKKTHVPVLVYHSVINDFSEKPFSNMIGITIDRHSFEMQMNYIKRKYNVIPLAELSEAFEKFHLFCKPPLVITFDDGYYDNYQNAFPVLSEYGLSATIFLIADYIGSAKILWWNILDFLMQNRPETIAALLGLDKPGETCKCEGKRQIEKLKRFLSNQENIKKIQSLAEKLDSDEAYQTFKDRTMLKIEEIKTMVTGNMDFGIHGLSHQALAALNSDSQQKEIFSSMERLKDIFQKPVTLFAYPLGHRKSFTSETKKLLARAGIKYALVNWRGLNNLKTDRYEIKRIIVQPMPLFAFKVRLSALMMIDRCRELFLSLFF